MDNVAVTRPVPAATAALRVLRLLSTQPQPIPAGRIAAELGLPRSTTYHLLRAMAAESFVLHYEASRTWGVGVAAWEVGQGWSRQEPLARVARRPLADLVHRVGHVAHLAVLHGADVLYVLEERASGRPPLVTDVGVRLPAHLTATGRAILASLPAAQVRALYPGPASFTTRTGRGPASPSALRQLLAETRRQGYASEDSEVTEGFASVALPITAPSVVASVAVTWPAEDVPPLERVLHELGRTAGIIRRRLEPGT